MAVEIEGMEMPEGCYECDFVCTKMLQCDITKKSVYKHLVHGGKPDTCPLRERKTGRWRHYEKMLTCSVCGAEYFDDIMEYLGDDVPKFCPSCGAMMKEGD